MPLKEAHIPGLTLGRAVQTAGGQEPFDAAVTAMLDDARGWRLAEMRRRRGMTQEQVATRMGVSVARISQSQRGARASSRAAAARMALPDTYSAEYWLRSVAMTGLGPAAELWISTGREQLGHRKR